MTGCMTTMTVVSDGLSSKPYAATRHNAVVAWDVGAMRYKKYTFECPAFIGWLALADLPFSAIADTAILPLVLLNDSGHVTQRGVPDSASVTETANDGVHRSVEFGEP